jgi:flagellar biosynthesis/type III secretory pathway protein FliH
VIGLKTIGYQKFLDADIPEAVIWAILADYGDDRPDIVIHRILDRINELSKDKTSFGKHVRRLEVLSKLRKLQPLFIKISEDMAFTYDLKTDIRYKQGKAEGKAEGKDEGIAEGIVKGKKEGLEIGMTEGAIKKATIAATKMLRTQRFAIQEIAEFLEVSVEFVAAIQTRITKKPSKK